MTKDELREWMAARGYSIRALAALLDVHPMTINAWRMGHHAIPAYLWRALAHIDQEQQR